MPRKSKFALEPFALTEWERDVLREVAYQQSQRHPRGDVRSDRWKAVAEAIRDGRPVSFDPKEGTHIG